MDSKREARSGLTARRWTPEEAAAIHKSIRRNHVAFWGWGAPPMWDFPTLHATYPHLAAVLREVVDCERAS